MKFNPAPFLIDRPDDDSKIPDNFSNVVVIGKSGLSKPFTYNSYYSIKYTARGDEQFLIDNKYHRLRSGEIMVTNQGYNITYLVPPKPVHNLTVFFQRELMSEVFATMLTRDDSLLAGNLTYQGLPEFHEELGYHSNLLPLPRLVNSVFETVSHDPQLTVLPEFYYELCSILVKSQFKVTEILDRLPKQRLSTRIEVFKKVDMARRVIEDTYTKRFDLDFVARETGMSKFYLIKCFQSVLGFTPNSFSIFLRIKQAQELLKNKNITIQEVGQRCGYADIFTFSKQFKKVLGVSPSVFRQSV